MGSAANKRRLGTERRRKCFSCGRPIGTGREYVWEGHFYGVECVNRIMDAANIKKLKEKGEL